MPVTRAEPPAHRHEPNSRSAPLAREASAYPPLAPTAREAHTHYATDMFCSSKLMTTPRGGESPPSRDGKAPPNGVASGGDVDQPLSDQLITISVCGAPQQTHALRLKRSGTTADLSAAVEQLGYDLSAHRLCHLGGASLPLDDSVTLAESSRQKHER